MTAGSIDASFSTQIACFQILNPLLSDFSVLPRLPTLLVVAGAWFAFFLAGTLLLCRRLLIDQGFLRSGYFSILITLPVIWGGLHLASGFATWEMPWAAGFMALDVNYLAAIIALEILVFAAISIGLWARVGVGRRLIYLLVGGLILIPVLMAGAASLLLQAEAEFRSHMRQEANLRLELVKGRLESLNKHAFDLLKIAAIDPAVSAAVQDSAGSHDFAFRILNRRVGADAVFLLDREGRVVTSSDPVSNGLVVNFRPYFIRAMAGEANVFYARSLTRQTFSGYFARPVLNEAAQIIAILVLRFDIEKELETYLRADNVVLHRNGIILIGPEGLSRGTLFFADNTAQTALSEQLVSAEDLRLLGFDRIEPDWLLDAADRYWMWVSLPLPGAVWEAGKLVSTMPLEKYRDNQMYLLLALLSVLLLVMLHYCKSQALLHLAVEENKARHQAELAEREARRQVELSNQELILARDRAEYLADRAEAANRAKSDFLANMSHEIRTPMNGVIGMTELALESSDDNERREYLSIVRSSAHSLLGIINDILDFSKIEAGKLVVERVQFNLRQTLQEAVQPLSLRAQEKGLAFSFDISPDVPDLVQGDPTRVRQVVLNLLGNALKFTQTGGIGLTVRVLDEESALVRLEFAVSDTGIGIEAEKLGTIFEAFAQADTSTTRSFGGTGLGLTITQRLLELMSGSLQVESTPGQGSRFVFTLPFTVDPDQVTDFPLTAAASKVVALSPGTEKNLESVAEVSPAGALPLATSLLEGLRVLLAEDNLVNQKLAQRLLEKWGCQVTVANNGREACDLVNDPGGFAVVLMDVQMPVMSGIEAVQHLRQLELAEGRQRLPVVAMTANAMKGDREICLEAGMDDYLSKPINQAELKAKLLGLFGTEARSA